LFLPSIYAELLFLLTDVNKPVSAALMLADLQPGSRPTCSTDRDESWKLSRASLTQPLSASLESNETTALSGVIGIS